MTRVPKQRADLLLVALGLAESRARAQALILAGKVFTDGKRVEKAGDLLPDGVPLVRITPGSRAGGSSLPMR